LLAGEAPELMRGIIARLYELADQAVAFTSLSSWAPRREADEFHADPLETAAFCRTLSPRLALRHDYHPGDFAIYMYRPR
jgi:hypothetical protein